MNLAPKVAEAELARYLLDLLASAEEPLPASKLAQLAPSPFRKQKKIFGPILEDLVAEGRAYRFSPFHSQQPRYWIYDARHYARTLIVYLLTHKGPCKPTEVAKGIKSRLKGWPTEEL